MWKYYIVLSTERHYGWLVEGAETSDGCPLGNDYNMAKEFNSPDELNKWVKENTSFNIENEEYGIHGIYYKNMNMNK